jgi:alpha-tubulin suppressor-like RCC1 family protein
MCTKTDGTLFAWGNGGVGQIGIGYGTFKNSPVKVGTLNLWITPTQAGRSVLCTQA